MPGFRAENRKNVVSRFCKSHNKQHLAVPKVYYIIFQNKKDADAYASYKKYASTYARCKKHADAYARCEKHTDAYASRRCVGNRYNDSNVNKSYFLD